MASSGIMTENPLLIEEFLETLFQYVTDIRDLKSVRLVCHSWNKESESQWRKYGVVCVLEQAGGNRSGKYPTIMEHLQQMSDGGGGGDCVGSKHIMKPFRRYKLKNWDFDGSSKDEVLFQEWLGSSSSVVVTYLHLDHCTFPYPTFLFKMLASSFPSLVKLVWSNSRFKRHEFGLEGLYPREVQQLKSLKTLEVTEEYEHSRGRRLPPQHLVPDCIRMFILGCPLIDELIIRKQKRDCFSPGDRGGYMSLFLRNAAFATYDNTAGTFIRKLDIMDFYKEAVLRFAEGNFPWTQEKLEELAVDVGAGTSYDDGKRLFDHLANHATLQVLKAFRAPLNRPYESVPLYGDRMEHLRELHLWGTFTTDLEFLVYTPVLQTLVLKRNCFDKKYKLKRMLGKHSHHFVYYTGDLVEATLERRRRREQARRFCRFYYKDLPAAPHVPLLEQLEIDYDFSSRTIPVLATWAPNVKTLKMVLANDTLKVVPEVWPRLRELECLFGSEVDDDGVSCLRRMRELRKFTYNAFCHQSLISSSANPVFLGMTALDELNICVSNKMSKKSVEELMQKISRVTIIRNSKLGHKHECCDQLKFFKKYRCVGGGSPTSRMGRIEPNNGLANPRSMRNNNNQMCIVV